MHAVPPEVRRESQISWTWLGTTTMQVLGTELWPLIEQLMLLTAELSLQHLIFIYGTESHCAVPQE